MEPTPNRALSWYMLAITVLATPLVVVLATTGAAVFVTRVGSGLWWTVLLFGAAVVVGELRPIPISRGINADDEITVSTTFGFGLVLVAPVFAAVVAQTIGLLIDAVRNRTPRLHIAFNIAQYASAYAASRAMYVWLSGNAFTPSLDERVTISLPAALAAGAVFIATNNMLVAVAVSIHTRTWLHRVLIGDLQWQLATSAPLIAVGIIAVVTMSWNVWAFVLLLMPIVALHYSGSMLMRREREARSDSLTGLANRAMVIDAADRRLTDSTVPTAMLLIDLDHFKEINDTLGHAAGDHMLIAVAERLAAGVGRGDVVARLGGDEFAVLTSAADGEQTVCDLAARLGDAVRQPVVHDELTLQVGCSIGIAFGPEHASTVSDLLRCADVALYESKRARNTATVYDRLRDDRVAGAGRAGSPRRISATGAVALGCVPGDVASGVHAEA